jgi:predicted DNA-binding protein with PD1-like motif
MQTGLMNESDGTRTYALIFEKDDDFMEGMQRFARENAIEASHFTAIGAFSDIVLEYFDRQQMGYKQIPLREQVEVLSMVGNLVRADGEPKVHAHVVVGRADGTTRGGHIGEAHVWPTLEVIVTEEPAYIRRKKDEETGLVLIDLEASRLQTGARSR